MHVEVFPALNVEFSPTALHFVVYFHCSLPSSHFPLMSYDAAQGNKNLDHENQQVPHTEEKIFSDEELHTLVDPILQSDDVNHDGYIKHF